MGTKTRNTIIAIVTALAFGAGNLFDQYQTGQLTYESAKDLGGEALACYNVMSVQVESMGKQVPAGPLAAFCSALASQPDVVKSDDRGSL